MRIFRLTESSEMPLLAEGEEAQPRPGRGEVLIRVLAAGVTPTEVHWYPTTHRRDGTKRSGAVPSHEFSGIVAALGEDAAGFEPGQEVYGMNDWFAEGAMAEYCLTQPSFIACKPAGLSHAEAASVPIGALTAWQGLYERARLQAGERILVHGGAGSVGMFAVQLARLRGAEVIATASARNLGFVSQLGAQAVIDYRAARFEESAGQVDVVFDTVGAETLERSWSVLKPGGRMVTVAANAEGATDDRVKQAFFIVEPKSAQLTEIGALLQAGRLRTLVDAVTPFAEAMAAYTRPAPGSLGRGKLVVAMAGTNY